MYVSNCRTYEQNNGLGNRASLNILFVCDLWVACNGDTSQVNMWIVGVHILYFLASEDSVSKCCRAWLGESNIRGIRQRSWHDFVSECGLIIAIPDPPPAVTHPSWLRPPLRTYCNAVPPCNSLLQKGRSKMFFCCKIFLSTNQTVP